MREPVDFRRTNLVAFQYACDGHRKLGQGFGTGTIRKRQQTCVSKQLAPKITARISITVNGGPHMK
jgi:hypothetical protein